MERSDERLRTRDIASPSSGETEAPPQRFEREDRDSEDGGALAADRAQPVGDGDVVTDDRAATGESIADPADAGTGDDSAARDTRIADDTAGRDATVAGDTSADDASADDTSAAGTA